MIIAKFGKPKKGFFNKIKLFFFLVSLTHQINKDSVIIVEDGKK